MAHALLPLGPRRYLWLPLFLLLLSRLAVPVEGLEFATVVNFFALQDPLATKENSETLCKGMGGFLATEPTPAAHAAVVAAAQEAGGGNEWYAFLGADTRDPTRKFCPKPFPEEFHHGGATCDCYWRWNQGRWRELQDDRTRRFFTPGIGVTFFIGNHFRLEASEVGPVSGFASYFPAPSTTDAERRPNCLLGNDLLAIGNGAGSIWSDNLATGGYSYAGYAYSEVISLCVWNESARAATKSKFLAICEIQAPTRGISEVDVHDAAPESTWWVVYFSLLFVALFIIFLIVWRCQDREDGDEPLEEAPDWVQQEAGGLVRSKSCVSQRMIECPVGNILAAPHPCASGRWNASQIDMDRVRAASMRSMRDFSPTEGIPATDFSRVYVLDRKGSHVD
ncbi:unnamed protein product [Phytomonas sp. EM1]|nr:unnamed protein product [Phytomonas sp. EM1]|eukprot:CCW61825.1 unnamed protein product [Phytomonas sp. isolate EM1]